MESEKRDFRPDTQFTPLKSKAGSILIIAIALTIGFGGGFLFAKTGSEQPLKGLQPLINKDAGKPQGVDFSLFWSAWDIVQQKYVDKSDIDTQSLVYGAVSGMVDALGDPFSSFFPPEESKKFKEEISGQFGGVGMELGIRDERLTVVAPLKDTPAFRAGILAGDKIVKINGEDATNLSIESAVSLIRGRPGTQVTITITREGLAKPRDITLTRENIKIPTVEVEYLGSNKEIAHLSIYSFNSNVDDDFKKAAREILSSNADRIILDVRNNPGGLLDSSIYIASWFLNENDVVTIEQHGNGTQTPFKAQNIGSLKHLPIVILINKGSASASEILAGAIKDNRKVQTIGEKTFGKGSVQELFPIGNTTIKITIAKWLTPSGKSIHQQGIEPDIEVKITEDDITNERDPQLDKAVDVVKNLR